MSIVPPNVRFFPARIYAHLVSFHTHSSTRFPPTTTQSLFLLNPVPIRLTHKPSQFYSPFLSTTTFPTRNYSFPFTHTRFATLLPARPLLLPSIAIQIPVKDINIRKIYQYIRHAMQRTVSCYFYFIYNCFL